MKHECDCVLCLVAGKASVANHVVVVDPAMPKCPKDWREWYLRYARNLGVKNPEQDLKPKPAPLPKGDFCATCRWWSQAIGLDLRWQDTGVCMKDTTLTTHPSTPRCSEYIREPEKKPKRAPEVHTEAFLSFLLPFIDCPECGEAMSSYKKEYVGKDVVEVTVRYGCEGEGCEGLLEIERPRFCEQGTIHSDTTHPGKMHLRDLANELNELVLGALQFAVDAITHRVQEAKRKPRTRPLREVLEEGVVPEGYEIWQTCGTVDGGRIRSIRGCAKSYKTAAILIGPDDLHFQAVWCADIEVPV